MSFLHIYDAEYRRLLDGRAEGFRKIFELLERKGLQSYRIIETGTVRRADAWADEGQSTRLFDKFVNYHDGVVFSVDLSSESIAVSRSLTSLKTHCVCADSVRFLHSLAQLSDGYLNFDLIYLDSFDFDRGDPLPSSFHHMKELTAIGKLKPGTIVAIDDNFFENGLSFGKGLLVHEYFSNIGVPLVFDGYQKIWLVPDER